MPPALLLRPDVLKRRSRCQSSKPETLFRWDSFAGRIRSWCKECDSEAQKARAERHRSVDAAGWLDRRCWIAKKSQRGVTKQGYESMFVIQDGRCAICGSTESGHKGAKHFAIDHDHQTGRVRGLLCARCNTSIGRFGDDPELLEAAAAYLRRAES